MREALWQFFERLFLQLPDYLKLIVVLALVAGMVIALVFYFMKRKSYRDLKKELKEVRKERDHFEDRLNALNQVDDFVWKRPALAEDQRLFEKRQARTTRFLAFCNLKGGVGKTTVTLNVGVGLAKLGNRVLLLDLDFQGTLSSCTLQPDRLAEYTGKKWTTETLLGPHPPADAYRSHAFPVENVAACRVMISTETLEVTEFSQQAKFFVDQNYEVRFHLLRQLHVPEVFQEYDYVLFDCPPRMTTGCINALTSADYVILPTSLSQLDIDAVRRTLSWLHQLRPVLQCEFLGVILSRCNLRMGELVQFEQNQLRALEALLAADLPGTGYVFDSKVPNSPFIGKATARKRAAALEPEGWRWFEPLCRELQRRIPR